MQTGKRYSGGFFSPEFVVDAATLTADVLLEHAATLPPFSLDEELVLLAAERLGQSARTVVGPFVALGHLKTVFGDELLAGRTEGFRRFLRSNCSAKIRIGAAIRTSNPSGSKSRKSAAWVTVFDIDRGLIFRDGRQTRCSDIELCWAGTGGYWHYVSLADVIKVERMVLPVDAPA